MAKPTALPEWDTSETNIVSTTDGHKTSGFITDEIPSSKEENFWRNLVYKWIQWLSGPTITLNLFDILGLVDASATSPGTANLAYSKLGYVYERSGDLGGEAVLPLANLPIGTVLETFRFRVADSAGKTWTVKLYVSEDGALTELATATSDGSGNVQTLTLDADSTEIETGKSYFLAFTTDVGATILANKFLYAAEVDIA